MQVEQNSLKLRIAKLEDNSAVMISTLNHPSMAEVSLYCKIQLDGKETGLASLGGKHNWR